MAKFQHLAVNWVDGMKISRQHFVETDHYHTEQVRQMQAAMLTPHNYGLLVEKDGSESLQIQILGDASQQIRIKVSNCFAITPDGSLIGINQRNELVFDTSLGQIFVKYHLQPNQNQIFYIIIIVNLFERALFGSPLENEIPMRHPYTLPAYSIDVVPAETINSQQWSGGGLIVGKIEYINTELKVTGEYIPASRTIKSHKELKDWYNRFGTYLNDIETYAFRIVQKIKTKSQKSALSDSIQILVERLINVIVSNNAIFQRLVPYQSPLEMIVLMIQSIQSIRASLECLTDREKEEVLGYLGEWAEESPGGLEKQILNVIQVPYDHNEIVSSLKVIDSFYNMWTALFLKLSQLEFIGKRKGQQVFIIESPVHETPVQVEKQKSRWSPL
ncbi:hypothetical protein [Dyadobacter frigoris]|uniref:Type VI secretion system baseplate subunit TssK n=1 Tax=Dyadobacter frigoris TaxID=2576211 RepID=A0A4V6BJZ2_9BACT|nr:hypothetical protein [Dyadobacter frigoris]TKT88923.1 hypothetical protein FDK13_25160 [Dyadobacter frigoris]GLU56978.1 hypothetical protein Dfri01_64390 [Dyadobacter frigoris]